MASSNLRPFDRFSDDAKQVLDLTQKEADLAGHSYIGTEHLLLAILDHNDNLGATALQRMDVTVEQVRAAATRVARARPEASPEGHGRPTAQAKRALEIAFQRAQALGQEYVGPEHLLLGLVLEREGVGTRVLSELGVSAERTRGVVTKLLAQAAVFAGQHSTVQPRQSSGPGVSLSTESMRALIRAHELAEAEGATEVPLEHLERALGERSEQ